MEENCGISNGNQIKYVVCYSGGHSSAIAAVETVRAFGKENVILLNHDLHPRSEDADIKRFKQEVADYLGLPITYTNMPGWRDKDQFDCMVEGGGNSFGLIHCTRMFIVLMNKAPNIEQNAFSLFPAFKIWNRREKMRPETVEMILQMFRKKAVGL